MSDGEIFWRTKGFGAYGRQLLNYFIRNPVTDPKLLVYLQQAVMELSERKDLRKELTDCIESETGFYNLGEFDRIENDCFRAKAFARSQEQTRKIIEILKTVKSSCLDDIRSALEKNLWGENLQDALKIASRKNHQIEVIGNETVKSRYEGDLPGHVINYVFDSSRKINCLVIEDRDCGIDRDRNFTAYQVVWQAIRKTLGTEGVKGLENIAFQGTVLSYLTGLASLTDVYEQHGIKYCFPIVNNGKRNELFFRDAIHPFIIGKNPTANDVNLNTNSRFYLIAGANNGGKTTYAKMIGLLTIMSQLGAPIPAEEARATQVEHVYTHFPKTESVADGKGRFVDELERLSFILENANSKDLVICDEPCSGTANEDSHSVSLDVIMGLKVIGCLTAYTTHIHSLQKAVVEDRRTYAGCKNLYVETLGSEVGPKFTHRIREGVAERSYGRAYAEKLLPVCRILTRHRLR